MTSSLMPELHFLEKKISEINRLPDKVKQKRLKIQENGGVISILKQTGDSNQEKHNQ